MRGRWDVKGETWRVCPLQSSLASSSLSLCLSGFDIHVHVLFFFFFLCITALLCVHVWVSDFHCVIVNTPGSGVEGDGGMCLSDIPHSFYACRAAVL